MTIAAARSLATVLLAAIAGVSSLDLALTEAAPDASVRLMLPRTAHGLVVSLTAFMPSRSGAAVSAVLFMGRSRSSAVEIGRITPFPQTPIDRGDASAEQRFILPFPPKGAALGETMVHGTLVTIEAGRPLDGARMDLSLLPVD